MATTALISGATTAATGETAEIHNNGAPRTVQASIAGTGAQTATVIVEGANEATGTYFETIVTFTLSGNPNDHGGYAFPANWTYLRARITTLTGTGATINVNLGA